MITTLFSGENDLYSFITEALTDMRGYIEKIEYKEFEKKSVEEIAIALIKKYEIKKLTINKDNIKYKVNEEGSMTSVTYMLPYSGDHNLWEMKPSKYKSNRVKAEIKILQIDLNYKIQGNHVELTQSEFDSDLEFIEFMIDNQNNQLDEYYEELDKEIHSRLQTRKNKIEELNQNMQKMEYKRAE